MLRLFLRYGLVLDSLHNIYTVAITIGLVESPDVNQPGENLTDDFEVPVTRALPRPMLTSGRLPDGKGHNSKYPYKSAMALNRWPEPRAAMHLRQMLQDKRINVKHMEHVACSTGNGFAMVEYFKWRSEFVIGMDEFSRLLKGIKTIRNQNACARAFVALAGTLENNTEAFKERAHAALTDALPGLFRATERNEAVLALVEKIRNMRVDRNRRKAFKALVGAIQKHSEIHKHSEIQLIGLAKAVGYLPKPKRQKAFDEVWPMTAQVPLDRRIDTLAGLVRMALVAPGVSLDPMFAHLDLRERDAVITAAVNGCNKLPELKMSRFLEALADGDFCRTFSGLLQVILHTLATSTATHPTKLNTLKHFIHSPTGKYSLDEISYFIRNTNENYFFPLIEDLLRQSPSLSSEEREAISLAAETRLPTASHDDTCALRWTLKLTETDGVDKIIKELAVRLKDPRPNMSCNLF